MTMTGSVWGTFLRKFIVTDGQACLGLTTALTGHKKAQCLIRRIKHLSYYMCDNRGTHDFGSVSLGERRGGPDYVFVAFL